MGSTKSQNDLSIEDLIAAATKPAAPEDKPLHDVEAWFGQSGIKDGTTWIASRTLYLCYKEWSLAPVHHREFSKIMQGKLRSQPSRGLYAVDYTTIEPLKAALLRTIGEKRAKKRRAKKAI
jgi:hypothetical protein